ncbi:MAG TPA: hypothetical protein VMI75_17240 [Polyangiaceae bacterium]|nr:hypothetical protein [Polyangiaceae bacterium]
MAPVVVRRGFRRRGEFERRYAALLCWLGDVWAYAQWRMAHVRRHRMAHRQRRYAGLVSLEEALAAAEDVRQALIEAELVARELGALDTALQDDDWAALERRICAELEADREKHLARH